MGNKKRKTEDALQLKRNVNTKKGNFVGRDKNTKVDRGQVYIGGDVKGSNIIIGDNNKINNQDVTHEVFFNRILQKIENRPDTSSIIKGDLTSDVEEIKTELQKGEKADESFIARRLRNIGRIAPDIAEVVLATIFNPAAGFSLIAKKVAENVGKTPTKYS